MCYAGSAAESTALYILVLFCRCHPLMIIICPVMLAGSVKIIVAHQSWPQEGTSAG